MGKKKKTILSDAVMFLVLLLLSAAVLLVFSDSTSPLYPYNYGIDSAFNRFVGLNILRNKILYKDIWDHKGPLLFLIQAVGAIGGTRNAGPSLVFFLQILSLSVSLFFCWKSYTVSDLKNNAFIHYPFFLFASVLSLLVFSKTIEGGNLNEEWCLPFISCSLFLFAKYSDSGKNRHPRLYSFVHGVCCGVIAFIRVNNGLPVFCGLAVIALRLAKEREWRNIVENILSGILGFSFVAIPVLFYFSANNAFSEMIHATFIHNIKYMANETHITLSFKKLSVRFIPVFASLLILLVSVLRSGKMKTLDLILSAAATGSAVMLICCNIYLHYFTVFVPVFLVIFLNYFRLRNISGVTAAAGLLILFGCVYVMPLPGKIEQPVYTYVSSIPKKEKSSMISIWTSPEIYLNSGLMPISRFSSYQYKFFAVNADMKDEFVTNISNEIPMRIMVLSGHEDRLYPEIRQLLENKYKFETTDGDADIYKRVLTASPKK